MKKAGTSVKILVVDDNTRNIQVIGTILREAGYEIGFALDGKQALDLLKDSTDYDLVLMDIKMPVMDGFEACSIMKNDERLKEIPVIFLSASHDTENIIAALDLGGVDYVTKPFNAKELLARVHTHVQLKQKTLEVRNYAQALEIANATKDKFFSIIAHDLKNPFASILFIGSFISKEMHTGSVEEIKKKVDLISSAADSGYRLLENLLTWSRSQIGSITFQPVELDLEKVIRQCIDLISAQAEAKNIRIQFDHSGDLNFKTDEAMFNHILRNLLANAVKFTQGPDIVTVKVVRTDGSVEVSVIDNGIGISKEDIDRLFRIDGSIASRPGTQNEMGTGLGLILCAEFITKMGGTISVESQEGKGSRFTFILPAPN
jgi:two-component system, sensor histidine kinase and response regulator